MENLGEAIYVHMANARSGEETFCERIAHLVTHPGMLAGNSIVEERPRGCRGWAAGALRQAHVQELNTGSPGPEAVVEHGAELLEMATLLPAMRTIRHQPWGLSQRTCAIFKKLLQSHTHGHDQRSKSRDLESLQAEHVAARWA